MELNHINSLYVASWSYWKLQSPGRISDLSQVQHFTKRSTRKSLSVWEPLGCEVLKDLAATGNLVLMFIQVMAWAPTTLTADSRNKEHSAFLNIFDLLTDIFWRWKAFRLTTQEGKPPATPASSRMGTGPRQHQQHLSLTYRTEAVKKSSHDTIHIQVLLMKLPAATSKNRFFFFNTMLASNSTPTGRVASFT